MTPEQILPDGRDSLSLVQIRAAQNYLHTKRWKYPSTIIYNYKKTLNYLGRLF